LESENDELQVDTDLRSGQPDALGVRHGLEHVGDQGMQCGRVELLDGLGDAQQSRIAHFQDGMNHGEMTAATQSLRPFFWMNSVLYPSGSSTKAMTVALS